jgi:hypothetical protein
VRGRRKSFCYATRCRPMPWRALWGRSFRGFDHFALGCVIWASDWGLLGVAAEELWIPAVFVCPYCFRGYWPARVRGGVQEVERRTYGKRARILERAG